MATAGGQSGGRAGRADATSNRKKKEHPGQARGRAGRSPWWWCLRRSQGTDGVTSSRRVLLCSVKPSRAATRCTVRVVV